MPRTYGHITGVNVGTVFSDRKELSAAKVHAPIQQGIWGGQDGSESIVLNGGYVDDEDFGHEVIYTGHGGNDPNTKRQIADQELSRGNLGLVIACNQGLPVRVTRGPKCDPPYVCKGGYRYDGIYRVTDYWHEPGRDGFRIYRFVLAAIPEESTVFGPVPPDAAPEQTAGGQEKPDRVLQTILRTVRDTVLSRAIKEQHDYRCQVCDEQISVPGGAYAEAAHIRPLGRPHDGPDTAENILCLCPNHHVMFDKGAIWIDQKFIVQPIGSPLRGLNKNEISGDLVRYHRDHFAPINT